MNNQNYLKFWQLAEDKVLQEVKSRRQGLSYTEVNKRLFKFGKNEIQTEKKRPVWEIFLSQFKSPLVIILIFASIVSGFLGEVVSTGIIILIIIVSAVLAFFQEYKSELAINNLRKKVSLKATVIRRGKTEIISASHLVVGDIVKLDLGKVVPADLRLITTDDLMIDESLITGESFPVEKSEKPIAVKEYLPQRMKNFAFMGTHVVQGFGTGVVINAAKNTEFGKIAHLLETKPPETEFQKGIRNFGLMLSQIIIFFTLGIFLVLAVFKHNVADSLLFALAIAVGISPELLPIIITINLARGAQRMAKKSVIVKRLISIENLGNIDILCTDKTGTLTEGKISVAGYYNLEDKTDNQLLKAALECNSLTVQKEILGNPLDEAIINAAAMAKVKDEDKYKVLESIAFDFKRRKMSVILKKEGEIFLICKGAVDEILEICDYAEVKGKIEPITARREILKNKFLELEKKGFRLLLIANKKITEQSQYGTEVENKLTLVGYLTFFDQPKTNTDKSLKSLRELGVEIKILTGDSDAIAKYIGRQLGFKISGVVLGAELEGLPPDKVKKLVGNANIFAKITPEHKLIIINALKAAGHTVGFLGDGVNDAPALRAADVGISVDSAVDVAKEAADVVLLKKNLHVLTEGIIEGRKTFGNTLKYIFSTISSNYGNMFSVAGAAIILPFIPMLPAQILLLNFLSDLPMLAISTDRVDNDFLKKPKHWDIKIIRKFMTYFGLASSTFDFITFGVLIIIFKASETIFQTGWFWESFLTEVAIIFIIRTKGRFWASRPSHTLILTSILTTFIVLAFIYTKVGASFKFSPLPLPLFFALIIITAIYFMAVEAGKKMFYKKYKI